MSAVPVAEPEIEMAVRAEALVHPRPRVVSRPKPQLRIELGTRPSVASRVLAHTALFCAIAMSVAFVSGLTGQVMVEKARREGIRAVDRARVASRGESLLRARVEAMTRASSIDEWARSNGFVSPDMLPTEQKDAADGEKKAH